MANTNDILKAIESLQKNMATKEDLKNMATKSDLQDVKQSQGRTNTALEALAAGQQEIQANMATKADLQDLDAKLVKKVKSHEQRIENLEEHAGISNPHKN